MAEVKINVQEPSAEPLTEPAERGSLLEMTRRMMLASIGAVALAQDEMESFVNRLVERGQIAEQDGKRLIRDMVDRRRRETHRAEDEIERRFEGMMMRMNVPTRTDIETLSAKLTELSKKVDELKRSE